MKSLRWVISYILVAALGLWGAFAVTTKLMPQAHSQEEAPNSGELPAEFLKEIEATQVPASPNSAVQVESPVESLPAPPLPLETSSQPQSPPEAPAVANEQELQGAQAVNSGVGSSGSGYVYDPTGKRDPFKAHRTALKAAAQKDTSGSTPEVEDPLLKYELDKFELVGILWDVKNPRAVVRDPEGNVFNIMKNTKVGRADGFVAAIRDGEIVVIETVYSEGRTTREPRVLELKK